MSRCRLLMAAGGSLLALAAQAADAPVQLRSDEPRAFGYHVGDVVQRRVWVRLPRGVTLDTASLPSSGRRGRALELRAVRWTPPGLAGNGEHELQLEYQVFLSPPDVRTLELPSLKLRFDGGERVQEVRVDAWPLTVSPLAPQEASPRAGLGELRPAAPPPLIDTRAHRLRLWACAVLASLALAYLAQVYLLAPWWAARHRPFARAWQALRGLGPARGETAADTRRQAFRQLHQALNQTAGEVLFAHSLDDFLARHPRYRPLRNELQGFFERSRNEFFGPADAAGDPANALSWVLRLCASCRDLERGAA